MNHRIPSPFSCHNAAFLTLGRFTVGFANGVSVLVDQVLNYHRREKSGKPPQAMTGPEWKSVPF